MSLTILQGGALEQLKTLPDASIQCCVTSPPYFGLRRYLKPGHPLAAQEIGQEKTPDEFVANLVAVFREVRRCLKPDGVLFVNMGDSYCSTAGKHHIDDKVGEKQSTNRGSSSGREWRNGSGRADGIVDERGQRNRDELAVAGLKPKDLIGIPWLLAFALRADGWWLRQDIIWSKPNPMPESVTDRCTKAHEYIFLMTKSASYFYDHEAVKEDAEYREDARPFGGAGGNRHGDEGSEYDPRSSWKGSEFHTGKTGEHQMGRASKKRGEFNGKTNALPGREAFRAFTMLRNKRSVWSVATNPYKEAHFATFPPDLIKPCILAGSRPGDTVLDCFGGSGTTGQVAIEYGRKAILIELNPEYVPLIKSRCAVTPGLQLACNFFWFGVDGGREKEKTAGESRDLGRPRVETDDLQNLNRTSRPVRFQRRQVPCFRAVHGWSF